MAEVTITVRGEAECRAQPERATARVAVETEGGSRDDVQAIVSETAATLRGQLSQLREAGVVVEWSGDQLRTWSYRPWEQPGRQGAPVHHALVEFRAAFVDVAALGTWLSDVVPLDGVTVAGIEWSLTDSHRAELAETARSGAVADAVAKAGSYAHSLGLDDVRPVAVADAGMLDGGGHDQRPMAYAAHSVAAARESPGFTLVPQDVRVAVAVDVRFVAS